MWKSSSLWSIEYQDDDLIGKLMCHVSMLAVIQPFVAVGVALTGRSARAGRLTVGLILATLIARVLKKFINSPRPDAGHIVMPGNSGFPSDHSLSAAFAASFIYQECQEYEYRIIRLTSNIALALYPLLVMFSRVYLQYHTVNQVIAGYFVGIILARIWVPISIKLCKLIQLYIEPCVTDLLQRIDDTLLPDKQKEN